MAEPKVCAKPWAQAEDPREQARFGRYLWRPEGEPADASTEFGRLRREVVPTAVGAAAGLKDRESNRSLMVRALHTLYGRAGQAECDELNHRQLLGAVGGAGSLKGASPLTSAKWRGTRHSACRTGLEAT
jgi:hypothetical protein